MAEINSASESLDNDNTDMLKKQQRLISLLTWGLGLIGLLLIAHLIYSQIEVNNLRAEIARRLQTGDNVSMEAKAIAKTNQELVVDLQSKVGILENKQAETQNQQVSLSQMYQDLSKSKDDWILAEIEQVLSTANQQLLLSRNIDGALVALENGDRTLSRSAKPQFIIIRAAIARDIERLRVVPNVDTSGLVLKLDGIINEINKLSLLSSEKALFSQSRASISNKNTRFEFSIYPKDWGSASVVLWNEWVDDMWGEIHTLVRVQKVDVPNALMLSPTEAYYLRENLKLRLLSARLSLLSHYPNSFKNDINASLEMLDQYFDTSSDLVGNIKRTLRQIESSNLLVDIPNLSESLSAVQNYRLKN